MMISEAPEFLPMPISDAHRPAHARKRQHVSPSHPPSGAHSTHATKAAPGGLGGPAQSGFDYTAALQAAPGLDLAAAGSASNRVSEARGRGRRGRGRGSRGQASGGSSDGRQKTRKMVNPWAAGDEDAGFGSRGGGPGGRGQRGRGPRDGGDISGSMSRNRSMPKAGNKSMNF